jgi:hypothetical protein
MSVTNLPYIQQQMTCYGMSTYFALGIIGNIFNIIVFTRPQYRHTPSSVYFLALATIAILYLNGVLAPSFYTLNHVDPQTYSLFYCKLKHYITHVLGQCNRFIVVAASADRFFATQTSVRIRSLSSVRVARRVVFLMCPIWLVIAVHVPILTGTSGTTSCGIFGLYKLIYAVYQIIVTFILPPLLMCIFSTLTIRHLYQLHGPERRARQRDRSLMRLVIAEVTVNIVTSFPSSINTIYGAATLYVTNKSAKRLQIESFLSFVALFILYLLNVAPFYMLILTSKPFRKEFINIIVKFWYKYILRRLRIVPFSEQNNATTMIG